MKRSSAVKRAEYEALVERVEDLEDALWLARAEATSEGREYLPVAMVERMIAGENPVRLWRRHREMTARRLAERAGVDPAYLCQIETGKKPGSLKAMTALARALSVDLEDIVRLDGPDPRRRASAKTRAASQRRAWRDERLAPAPEEKAAGVAGRQTRN